MPFEKCGCKVPTCSPHHVSSPTKHSTKAHHHRPNRMPVCFRCIRPLWACSQNTQLLGTAPAALADSYTPRPMVAVVQQTCFSLGLQAPRPPLGRRSFADLLSRMPPLRAWLGWCEPEKIFGLLYLLFLPARACALPAAPLLADCPTVPAFKLLNRRFSP